VEQVDRRTAAAPPVSARAGLTGRPRCTRTVPAAGAAAAPGQPGRLGTRCATGSTRSPPATAMTARQLLDRARPWLAGRAGPAGDVAGDHHRLPGRHRRPGAGDRPAWRGHLRRPV